MTTPENPTAGQGPVLLDIGGAVGALVVSMPEHTRGLEVEIRPAGATTARAHRQEPAGRATHGHPHAHPHAASPWPHVAVVERRTADGTHLALVYPAVEAGDYELCPVPGDEVALTVSVAGGEVTHCAWPG